MVNPIPIAALHRIEPSDPKPIPPSYTVHLVLISNEGFVYVLVTTGANLDFVGTASRFDIKGVDYMSEESATGFRANLTDKRKDVSFGYSPPDPPLYSVHFP